MGMAPAVVAFVVLLSHFGFAEEPKKKARPYRLPAVDLKEPVLWRVSATTYEGSELQFGGLVQNSEDPAGHTLFTIPGRISRKVTLDHLRKHEQLTGERDAIFKIVVDLRSIRPRLRSLYLEDASTPLLISAFSGAIEKVSMPLAALHKHRWTYSPGYRETEAALARLGELGKTLGTDGITPRAFELLDGAIVRLEQACECMDVEPSPRAMTAMTYNARRSEFVLFGGDHLDYLTNDTWLFDNVREAWLLVELEGGLAPPPRAGHRLIVNTDGTITLSGGYTYASNTDYMGGQYVDLEDGEWVLDLKERKWTAKGPGKLVPANTRTYRTGPFHPNYFIGGDKPDAAKFQQWLKDVPANVWKKTNPPFKPQMNRDWGTAVLDTDRDLILRWSGGHCAHGGTDVPQYHLATNRWELSAPVEFPLGLLYSNTSYPEGFSFNRRAWMTGHTYQSYAYDPLSKRMYFVGQHHHTYVYDPEEADWLPTRFEKPKDMAYGSSYYTLTCCSTPRGIYCWTKDGKLFLLESKQQKWNEQKLSGAKLAGSIVDNSTVLFDSARERLVFFRKEYGDKTKYDGTMQTVDLKTLAVGSIAPPNAAAASGISYLCQIRYDIGNDLYLAGCTLAPDAAGLRRTPAFDPKGGQWISLAITGEDPSGKAGRNVSLGLMYDPRQKCFWAVDTKSEVYVLRLIADRADPKPLE